MAKRIPKLHLTQQYRFWRNVDRSGGPDACWKWTGYVQGWTGYGVIGINGREFRVHRIAYFLEYGHIDDTLMVLHKCDVRVCVNPSHLYQGTAKDNSADMSQRRRIKRMYGETNGKAKLTRSAVLAIRRMCMKEGVLQKTAAKSFGVSEATVSYLVNGGRWKQLTGRKR